ncbi:MAG: hypothetical protein WBY94_29010 [Polyangiaceae bacterium]
MIILAGALAVGGCGAPPLRVAAIEDMQRVRSASIGAEEVKLAPEAYAHAEQEDQLALAAHASSDDVAAKLHAEHAIAAYAHARIVVRLARAAIELADAQKKLEDANAEEKTLEASRAALDRDADELEGRLRIARERLLPASSAPTTPEREAARSVAARSLAMQARLLCSAARMVAHDAPGLVDADSGLATLEGRLAKSARPAPIDEASRSRAHCLDVLTRARRGADHDADAADGLLAELSAEGGWDPSRDERGVTVTLRDSFRGPALTTSAAERLKNLGRVAAAHKLFGVQVVVHDANAPAPGDTTDAKRADAAVHALIDGGAAAARVRSEFAGALAPVVDPADLKERVRNERLEVVFVL